MKSFSALVKTKRTTCARILIAALIPVSALATGKMDVLPKSYLPPENLSIQESIDHVLTGMEAMGTYGEMHRTLRVFRPQSDHKYLAAMFKGIEKEPIPKFRRNGLTISVEVPGQGTLQMEFVNIEKARFRVQGLPYTYQFTKPFLHTVSELRGLIYKPKTSRFSFPFSFFPQAVAQFTEDKLKNVAIAAKGFFEFAFGYTGNATACPTNGNCSAEAKRQREAPQQTLAQKDEENLFQEKRLVTLSTDRKAACDDYGKKTWPKGHLKYVPCNKAIEDYRFYCERVKGNRSQNLIYKDGRSELPPNWDAVDCQTKFYFFAFKPGRRQNMNQGLQN
ncbi:MAG: hypothetical protein K2X47_01500 [Bdellovibrionales bacterium]|nr:hypothetical protein [Bdellovibrionales bacterium]